MTKKQSNILIAAVVMLMGLVCVIGMIVLLYVTPTPCICEEVPTPVACPELDPEVYVPLPAATFTSTPTSTPTLTIVPTVTATLESTPTIEPTSALEPSATPTIEPVPAIEPTITYVPALEPTKVLPPSWSCPSDTEGAAYVASRKSDKFHKGGCQYVARILNENRLCFSSKEAAVAAGYSPCGVCKP